MNYPPEEWRLLTTPPSPGAWNMAVDEAILDSVEQNLALPTLRLFAWEPACLSIGYAQPRADIDFTSLKKLGWDWVRRPTGGRAILHTDELTYSVIAPQANVRVAGGVLESYQRISVALLNTLHRLDIPAESNVVSNAGRNQGAAGVCFEVPSNYEIIVSGKKLIGSAQARRKSGVLQHGTFPLYGELARINRVLAYPDEAKRKAASTRLLEHATTAESILNHKLSWEDACAAFISGFQEELNIQLTRGELTAQESRRAKVLLDEKYTHPSWLDHI